MRARLRDGTEVVIRPLRPDDKALLREAFAHLSEGSRYRRCAHPVKELTDEQLRYFTEVDQRDHLAWAAVDATDPLVGLGIARCVRVKDRPNVAEVAVTVVDAHQGKGLGTLLLGVLARAAAENHIDTWIAYVVSDNAPMLHLFRDLGARTAMLEEPGVMRVEIPVPSDPEQLPQTAAGKVFRAVARDLAPEQSTAT